MFKAFINSNSKSSARLALHLALALLATGCASGRKALHTGADPSPDNLSTWIIPPGFEILDAHIKGDALRYSNATLDLPSLKGDGSEASKLRLPAGRLNITGRFRYTCVVARAAKTYRFDRREAPLDLTFLARPGGTYALQILGDGIPLEPGDGLAPGEPAAISGYANISGGACPQRIRLGVKGAPEERIVIIEKPKPAAPAPAAPKKMR